MSPYCLEPNCEVRVPHWHEKDGSVLLPKEK